MKTSPEAQRTQGIDSMTTRPEVQKPQKQGSRALWDGFKTVRTDLKLVVGKKRDPRFYYLRIIQFSKKIDRDIFFRSGFF